MRRFSGHSVGSARLWVSLMNLNCTVPAYPLLSLQGLPFLSLANPCIHPSSECAALSQDWRLQGRWCVTQWLAVGLRIEHRVFPPRSEPCRGPVPLETVEHANHIGKSLISLGAVFGGH